MKSLAALTLILAAFITPAPQEVKHAPTLQSCTADLNLWTAQIPGWPTPSTEQIREGMKSLTVKEMREREVYVGDCASAYPEIKRAKNNEVSTSLYLIMVYDIEIEERLFGFLRRHSLLDKFTAEDETGKR